MSYQRSGISLFNPILQIHCKPCFVGRSVYRHLARLPNLLFIFPPRGYSTPTQFQVLRPTLIAVHRNSSKPSTILSRLLLSRALTGSFWPSRARRESTFTLRQSHWKPQTYLDSSLLPSSLSPHSPRAHELSTHWSKQLPTRPTKQTTTCPIAEMSRVVRKQPLNRPSWSPGLPVLVSLRNGPSGFARL